MKILPKQYEHLEGTYLGEMMEAAIIRAWILGICKAILGLAIVAACVKYVF